MSQMDTLSVVVQLLDASELPMGHGRTGLFLNGAGAGCCFCVAVSVCAHKDPLTRTAFRCLSLHLLEAWSPPRAQGQAGFATFLRCQLGCPSSFDTLGSNSLAERATDNPRSQSQICHSTLLLLERKQQRGFCFSLGPAHANAHSCAHLQL